MIRQAGNRLIPGRHLLRHVAKEVVGHLFELGKRRDSQSSPHIPDEKTPTDTTTQKRNEAYYRDKLARKLGGETEIVTPDGGRIDVMTSDEIIEIKYVKKWRSAFGQIKSYGFFHPKHTQRIHLFGGKSCVNSVTVERICRRDGVRVTWEEDE